MAKAPGRRRGGIGFLPKIAAAVGAHHLMKGSPLGNTLGRVGIIGAVHSGLRRRSSTYRQFTNNFSPLRGKTFGEKRAMLGKRVTEKTGVSTTGNTLGKVRYQRSGLATARQGYKTIRNTARQAISDTRKAWRGASGGRRAAMVGTAIAGGLAAHWATKPLRAQAARNRALQARYGVRPGPSGVSKLAALGLVGAGVAYARHKGMIGGGNKAQGAVDEKRQKRLANRKPRHTGVAHQAKVYARALGRKFAPTKGTGWTPGQAKPAATAAAATSAAKPASPRQQGKQRRKGKGNRRRRH